MTTTKCPEQRKLSKQTPISPPSLRGAPKLICGRGKRNLIPFSITDSWTKFYTSYNTCFPVNNISIFWPSFFVRGNEGEYGEAKKARERTSSGFSTPIFWTFFASRSPVDYSCFPRWNRERGRETECSVVAPIFCGVPECVFLRDIAARWGLDHFFRSSSLAFAVCWYLGESQLVLQLICEIKRYLNQ